MRESSPIKFSDLVIFLITGTVIFVLRNISNMSGRGKRKRSSRVPNIQRRIRREVAEIAFENAFSHVPIDETAAVRDTSTVGDRHCEEPSDEAPSAEASQIEAPLVEGVPATRIRQRETRVLDQAEAATLPADDMLDVILAANRNEDYEEDLFNADEGNVGFGNADFYDTREIMELATEDGNIGGNHDSLDDVKNLKSSAVADESKKTYRYSIINFLYYIYTKDRKMLNNSWLAILDAYNTVQNEKERVRGIKMMIRKLIRRSDEECPPIEFEKYKPEHFMKYLLSLEMNGKRLSASAYNGRRSALNHLYTIYNKKTKYRFQK